MSPRSRHIGARLGRVDRPETFQQVRAVNDMLDQLWPGSTVNPTIQQMDALVERNKMPWRTFMLYKLP